MEVSRPSNIALIKYMGKIPELKNVPTNSSFSWTIDALRTFVALDPIDLRKAETASDEVTDTWAPLTGSAFQAFEMSEKGKRRYLEFWAFLKNHFGIKEAFALRSGNNFPADCGLASSASSFAALTEAAYQVARLSNSKLEKTSVELGELSRQGSGSSCRSFFSPWCVWDAKGVKPVELAYQKLSHHVIVISEDKKTVSSSEAHVRVTSSPLFADRPKRAEERLHNLLYEMGRGNWDVSTTLVWDEFVEMHELFHTSKPGFTYFNKDVQKTLDFLRDMRKSKKDSPLVTMDAGPNIHLLFNEDQRKLEKALLADLKRGAKIISSVDFHV